MAGNDTKALLFKMRLDIKQKCRPELCHFHFSWTGSETQTESKSKIFFLVFKFHQMDRFCSILNLRPSPLKTSPKSLLFGSTDRGFRPSPTDSFSARLHDENPLYVQRFKRKKTVQIPTLCFNNSCTVLLIWKTRGEVTSSLVAVK